MRDETPHETPRNVHATRMFVVKLMREFFFKTIISNFFTDGKNKKRI